jgi:ribosomal protein S18 acetylase RimI-like enzyme
VGGKMISYKRCTETTFNIIHEAFSVGFSDYILKMEIPLDLFIKRFFGPEGNNLEHSFIAFDDEVPVGLILGGIRVFDGIKTLRCGALCVHPQYRGKGISKELFELHKKVAIDNQCKQLFLEVIVGNDRAIKFYENMGYDIVYSLRYLLHDNPKALTTEVDGSYKIEETSINTLRNNLPVEDMHIPWQNTFDYMSGMEDVFHYVVRSSDEISGAISAHKNGKIFFLWVRPSFRNQNLGKYLVSYVATKLELSKVIISFANNGSLEGFLKHLGFKRDSISQYEMYLTL